MKVSKGGKVGEGKLVLGRRIEGRESIGGGL